MKKFCFNVDNRKVKFVYVCDRNYSIEENNTKKNKLCVIYFSSHGIYYPNDETTFVKKIIRSNYYEWYRTRHIEAHKHIFVRDVYKQWYLRGINSEINTHEKLFDFLKRETQSYEVITIGASAGGYAAILYGNLLKVSHIIAFNPLIEIESKLLLTKEEDEALLHRMKHSAARKYYNINKYRNSEVPLFWIYSIHSKRDVNQLKRVESLKNIFVIKVNSEVHGVPLSRDILPFFISLDKKKLKTFTSKIFLKRHFCKSMGMRYLFTYARLKIKLVLFRVFAKFYK